jgi:hemerythrin-like metal-binding protein
MDDTHREFVDLLTQVVNATDTSLLCLWRELIKHTALHFAREDRWMKDTGFASTNCHSTQHQVVLQVMREGDKRGNAGDLAIVRQMAEELGIWFPQHAKTMDAALALHLHGVGHDESTGQVNMPESFSTETIEGCHNLLCTSHNTQADKLASV